MKQRIESISSLCNITVAFLIIHYALYYTEQNQIFIKQIIELQKNIYCVTRETVLGLFKPRNVNVNTFLRAIKIWLISNQNLTSTDIPHKHFVFTVSAGMRVRLI